METRSTEENADSGGTNARQSASRKPQAAIRAIPAPVRIGMVLVLIALASVTSFLYVNRPKPSVLTDKDTILLTEFENRTGDAIFDGALRQGLTLQLQQSPFLELCADARIQQALRQMNRAPEQRVTHEVGREIARQQGVKAVITGALAKPDRYYALTLEALDSQTGARLALTQTEAESRDAVLRALTQAAAELRTKLGEKLITVRRYAAPLEAAASSLEALKAYTLATEAQTRGEYQAAIPLYQRVIELDPTSTIAYSGLAALYGNTQQAALAVAAAAKAYELRERAGELENFRLTFLYHSLVTGELEKCVETLKLQQRTYPRDLSVYLNLADSYGKLGQFALAAETAAEALRLNPHSPEAHWQHALYLIRLNRFEEARAVCQRAVEHQLDSSNVRAGLYQLAFLNDDTTALQQQLAWARGRPAEHPAWEWQAQAAAFGGQLQRAWEFNRQAIALATQRDTRAIAAQYSANHALRAAVAGQCSAAQTSAKQALALERQKETLTNVALAHALCNQPALAQPLLAELVKRFPKDTLVTGLWLPVIRAALELQRGHADLAIEQLQTAQRLEAAAEFWPQYLRGLTYLKLNQFPGAEAEFKKILAQRGAAPLSELYPLAHLGLARAAQGNGAAALARQRYQEFLAFWKAADAALPVLRAASKEFEAVR